ncbi:MAG: hypothetical protein P8098_18030, partial [Candidatus Thiodiazotropha sp.]
MSEANDLMALLGILYNPWAVHTLYTNSQTFKRPCFWPDYHFHSTLETQDDEFLIWNFKTS